METKTNKAVNLARNNEWKRALGMFKNFHIGFTKDDKRTISIAYESLCGSSSFYQSLGINVNEEIEKAKEIIKTKYNI